MNSKFIKPSVFNADPNSNQTSKEGRHEYGIFLNFVDSFPAESAISNEDKLKCLIARISKMYTIMSVNVLLIEKRYKPWKDFMLNLATSK